jgi:membrane protein implicated in regulation of membrane protease activity
MGSFVFKVMALSAVLAIAIKYGGPTLSLAATSANALIAVWLPSLLMAILLSWRWQKKAGNDGTQG